MRKACVAALLTSATFASLGLGGCSSAEGPRVAVAPPARKIAPPVRPPRVLAGEPVVVALRRPTPTEGVEWAWLLPQERLVTLLAPDSTGARAIGGAVFLPGPNGAFVSLDRTGHMTLAADGQAHALGPQRSAVFDGKGARLLSFRADSWSLVARDGTVLRTEAMGAIAPLLLDDGTVIADAYEGSTVIGPDGKDRVKVPTHCRYPFSRARRVVCFSEGPPGSKTRAIVLDLDSGKELASFTFGDWHPSIVTFAARPDGGAIAFATDRIEVVELRADRPHRRHTALVRDKKNGADALARMAFTADGKRLCIEDRDDTHLIDPLESATSNWRRSKAEKDAGKTCLFAPIGGAPEGPRDYEGPLEWEAIEVSLSSRPGFVRVPRVVRRRIGDPTRAVSRDRTTYSVLEYATSVDTDPAKWSVRAFVADLKSGQMKAIVPVIDGVSRRYQPPPLLEAELSDDGSRLFVCPWSDTYGACRGFIVATGEALPEGEAKLRNRKSWIPWTGEWPETRIDTALAGIGLSPEEKSRVVAWRDTGNYVAIELDPGDGKTLSMNLPNKPGHVVHDVKSLVGGAVLAFAAEGVVELWRARPVELLALVIGTPEGGAAMFPDGSVEVSGRGAEAVACKQGERLFPPETCGDLWAEKGTLRALLRQAKNEL